MKRNALGVGEIYKLVEPGDRASVSHACLRNKSCGSNKLKAVTAVTGAKSGATNAQRSLNVR